MQNIKIIFVIVLLLLATFTSAQPEQPVEIRVLGRQPGPPMWKVTRGEHELWIFAMLSPIPKDMIWESDKVAAVIAQSQEYLGMPQTNATVSPLLLLNPINIFRGVRLAKRLSRNDEKASLAEVLPAAVYARFEKLKAQYFPRDNKIEKLRPIAAGGSMTGLIQQEVGLVSSADVMKTIRRLIKNNRAMVKTEIEVTLVLEGNFKTLSKRVEAAMASITPEQEIACLESMITSMETDLDEMKIRANSWAQGYVDEFRGIPAPRELHASCEAMILEGPEGETIQNLETQANDKWLDAAELALANNQSTFAVLGIYELLSDEGLLAQLQARGYTVKVP